MEYLKAFLVGGAICAVGQLLLDKTKLTPARILVCFVVLGVILGACGVYKPLVDFAGAGATVPLTGFGYNLAKGVKQAVAAAEKGDIFENTVLNVKRNAHGADAAGITGIVHTTGFPPC